MSETIGFERVTYRLCVRLNEQTLLYEYGWVQENGELISPVFTELEKATAWRPTGLLPQPWKPMDETARAGEGSGGE